MKRRVLKQKLDKVVISCGTTIAQTDVRYLVQEYVEIEDTWKTITYNNDFDTKVPAIFDNIEIAKLYLSGKVGVVEEEIMQIDEINLKEL